MEEADAGDLGNSRAVNYMFSVSLSPIQSDTEAESEVIKVLSKTEPAHDDNGDDIHREPPPWPEEGLDDSLEEESETSQISSLLIEPPESHEEVPNSPVIPDSIPAAVTPPELSSPASPAPLNLPAIPPESSAPAEPATPPVAAPKPSAKINGARVSLTKIEAPKSSSNTSTKTKTSTPNGTAKSNEKRTNSTTKHGKQSPHSNIPKPTNFTRQLKLIRSNSVGSGDSPHHSEVAPLPKTKIAMKAPRENKSSLQRKKQVEMTRIESKETEDGEEDYLTPLQKKTQQVLDLEREIAHMRAMIESRDWQLSEADRTKKSELEFLKCEREAEITELKESIKKLTKERDVFKSSVDGMKPQLEEAQAKAAELKAAFEKKENDVQEMYLIMYKKGQQSAMFERQVQLEDLATKAPQTVSVKELLTKLDKTQGELSKWQSIQRNDSYCGADRPDSEAQATLRFLRDSMFHYLTDHGKDQAQHLKAMVSILGFTDVQMKRIQKAILEKK